MGFIVISAVLTNGRMIRAERSTDPFEQRRCRCFRVRGIRATGVQHRQKMAAGLIPAAIAQSRAIHSLILALKTDAAATGRHRFGPAGSSRATIVTAGNPTFSRKCANRLSAGRSSIPAAAHRPVGDFATFSGCAEIVDTHRVAARATSEVASTCYLPNSAPPRKALNDDWRGGRFLVVARVAWRYGTELEKVAAPGNSRSPAAPRSRLQHEPLGMH